MVTIAISYYQSFLCEKDGSCCKKWDIYFTKSFLRSFQKPDHPFNSFVDAFNVTHPENEIFHAKIKHEKGQCIFLNEKNECNIFRTLGKENGNPLCLAYPFLKIHLADKNVLIAFPTCKGLLKDLFRFELDTCPIPNNLLHQLPAIDFSNLQTYPFCSTQKITPEAFEILLNSLMQDITQKQLKDIQLKVASLQRQILVSKIPLIEGYHIQSWINLPKENQVTSFPDALEVLNFFVQRKINLYHHPAFAQDMKDFLSITCNPKDWNSFNDEIQPFDTVLKRYFFLLMFYNLEYFLKDIQFTWHKIFFCIGLVKLLLYVQWRNSTSITEEIILETFQTTGRNFIHDTRIFEFWGRGCKGKSDFHPDSLLRLII